MNLIEKLNENYQNFLNGENTGIPSDYIEQLKSCEFINITATMNSYGDTDKGECNIPIYEVNFFIVDDYFTFCTSNAKNVFFDSRPYSVLKDKTDISSLLWAAYVDAEYSGFNESKQTHEIYFLHQGLRYVAEESGIDLELLYWFFYAINKSSFHELNEAYFYHRLEDYFFAHIRFMKESVLEDDVICTSQINTQNVLEVNLEKADEEYTYLFDAASFNYFIRKDIYPKGNE